MRTVKLKCRKCGDSINHRCAQTLSKKDCALNAVRAREAKRKTPASCAMLDDSSKSHTECSRLKMLSPEELEVGDLPELDSGAR